MTDITRSGNQIKIAGDIKAKESHYLLCTVYQAFVDRGYMDLILDFSQCTSVFAPTMVTLCSYALVYGIQGLTISLVLPESIRLSRLFVNSNWAYLIDRRSYEQSRFTGYRQVPTCQFVEPKQQSSLIEKVINSLLTSFEGLNRSDFAAIEWSINEIMDNVLVHSESPYGGLVQLTTFNNENKKIEMVVSDGGIGIPSSLRRAHPEFDTDVRALLESIEEGVTNGKGVGNGLFGSYNVCAISNGAFKIDSGGASMFYNTRDGMHLRPNMIPITGTTVVLTINCNARGTLEKALKFDNRIHKPTDFIETHYESADAGVVRFPVQTEARSFGSRVEGLPVRNKIRNLYSMSREQIVLDFAGVPIVSSSFADEVVAKLVMEIGISAFGLRFRFANLNDTVRNLINKSVAQRVVTQGELINGT